MDIVYPVLIVIKIYSTLIFILQRDNNMETITSHLPFYENKTKGGKTNLIIFLSIFWIILLHRVLCTFLYATSILVIWNKFSLKWVILAFLDRLYKIIYGMWLELECAFYFNLLFYSHGNEYIRTCGGHIHSIYWRKWLLIHE